MPLVKRNIEPRHLCRGGLPEGIGSELECVTNNTLSAIIRQLSSLSKHAEDVFGELFSEANTFYVRANGLQDRIDRLAVKVTQLDSTVEEVSLQDINMRKAFKSSTVQDQQVVSKSSTSNPVEDMYNTSDKPPSLSILSAYRDDHTDGMKFYTDPSYFFDLWKEKMLQDTEDKRKERRRQREQKRCVDGTLQREVKKVRKARNRRQEWNMMAFDKELRPDHRHPHSLHRGASSEGSLSPESRYGHDLPDYPTAPSLPHSASNHALAHPYPPADIHESVEHEYHSIGVSYREGALNRTHHSPPLHRSTERINGTMTLPPADYRYCYCNNSQDKKSGMQINNSLICKYQCVVIPDHHPLPQPLLSHLHRQPLARPPPPPVLPAPPQLAGLGDGKRQDTQPRSDLLSAIRMGIQLKKVQEQQEQQAKREPVGNDVATILSRRIAVEYSDSEDDSELEENDWSD
uniref:Wiskott-Aldrich syndrome protein family member n=1 Tax=Oncorhynchus tshawytscha TaxID=74940 RepID=A0AAZ3RIC7_ONCTS